MNAYTHQAQLEELADAMEAVLGRIEIRGTIPIQINLAWRYGEPYLELLSEVPDRDTGYPVTIRTERRLPHLIMDDKERVRFLFSLVREMYLHEAGEQFRVDGVLPFDPHVRAA